MSWSEMVRLFMEHNETNPDETLVGYVVYKASNWPEKEYSEQERTYAVYSSSNGFFSGKISNCVYGDCLDGRDLGVRLDWYDWKKEYCYMV